MDTVNETAAGGLASGAAPAMAALLSSHVSSSQIQISLFAEADEAVVAPQAGPSCEPELKKLRKRAEQQEGQIDEYRQQLMTGKKQLDDQRTLVRELQLEKDRYTQENRKRIALRDQVEDALETLARKDLQCHRISMAWACTGALALIMGGLYFGALTFLRPAPAAPLSWEYIVFCLSHGGPALVVLGLLAGYAFRFSMSYLRESLNYADRGHAIHLGRLILDTCAVELDGPQLKQAFEHWNLVRDDTFPSPPGELGNGPLALDLAAMAGKLAAAVRKPEAADKAR